MVRLRERVLASSIVNFMLETSRQAISRRRKAMAARARRKRAFCQRQAQQLILFAFTLSICLLNCLSTTRTIWAKERSSFWWEYIVNNAFTSHDWITNFRMSRATFMYVCNHLRPSITKKETVMRKSISAEKRLAITLYYLATNSDFRTVGHLFGVSKSSVCLIVKEVCATIVDVLLPKHLSFPSGDALRAVITGFQENHKFPQCVGLGPLMGAIFQSSHHQTVQQIIITGKDFILSCYKEL